MPDITILDGGLGQELIRRSAVPPTPLWATQVMIDRPDLVQAVHEDFFAAGAEVATANTYALHRDRLDRAGLGARQAELVRIALGCAAAARETAGGGRIAGSIGPLGASYRPELHPDHETAVGLYSELMDLLSEEVDLVIFETVASVAHARAARACAAAADRPVWIAMTVDDEDGARLRSGEPLGEAVKVAADGASAVLANCSAPEAMPAALDILARAGLPFGAYANGFTQITNDFLKDAPTVDSLQARRDVTPDIYAGHVAGWVERGATIVGGCCEIAPVHIAAMVERLRRDARIPV